MNVTKGNVVLAPTKEDMSLKAYSMKRRLNRLRKSACVLFQSDPIVRVIEKVEREIECGRLAVRTDRKLHADLGEYTHSHFCRNSKYSYKILVTTNIYCMGVVKQCFHKLFFDS